MLDIRFERAKCTFREARFVFLSFV